ncbi:MAG: periplasmic heavy metal sensor [Alphaproteobacteria bacterium]|nr:MAG: periplasmic heavy metal sensor [Alphaproteobacteria bacterium]
MTMAMALEDRSSRWLLVGSLALNLFFIGTIGALVVRHYVMPAQPAATERPRTAAARMERLAAPLPAADAEKLRAAFRAREAAAESAREALNRAFDRVNAALRREPFDPAQLRAALGEVRAARPGYEQVMQEIYLTAATAMSAEGRARLADGPAPRPGTAR